MTLSEAQGEPVSASGTVSTAVDAQVTVDVEKSVVVKRNLPLVDEGVQLVRLISQRFKRSPRYQNMY